ncbi:MAG: Gx transporter family protein [Clostridia bacterium]|nr:Gx transporter family protein [Clostridia bacterium]
MYTKQLARGALLVAAAMALSYFERLIPLNLVVPLPGVKLGLANIVTMFALYALEKRQAFLILVLRCFLGSVFGGLSGLAMSMTGGVLAFWIMALAKKLPLFSIYGVSILGAAAHNLGQVLAASVLMGSVYTFYYLPFLLLTALVTGAITGTICAHAFRALPQFKTQEDLP